jgi:hypothetical protein
MLSLVTPVLGEIAMFQRTFFAELSTSLVEMA